MSDEKKTFLDSQFYPILFMLVITVVFVGILSGLYRSTEAGIEAYRKETYQLQILSLFADTLSTLTGEQVGSFLDRAKVKSSFDKYVKTNKTPLTENMVIGNEYYAVSDGQGNLIGNCYDITGSGLWGTMRGLLALSPDMKTIINFAVYDQMETPGLGSRVEEDWFKGQFAGKPFTPDEKGTAYVLVPEDAQPKLTEIRQITGATITTSSVIKMIQAAEKQFAAGSARAAD